MALRPDPLQDLLDLQERMNRLFEDTLSRERLDDPALVHGAWVPLADVFETSETYVIEVELPGLGLEDVEIHAHGDELVVRGERRPSPGGRPEAFHRLERRYGPFARGFRFGDEVEPDQITAEFADGLLRLVVPKSRPGGAFRSQPRVGRDDRGE